MTLKTVHKTIHAHTETNKKIMILQLHCLLKQFQTALFIKTSLYSVDSRTRVCIYELLILLKSCLFKVGPMHQSEVKKLTLEDNDIERVTDLQCILFKVRC